MGHHGGHGRGDALAGEGLYFYDFFTLKFSPVKFVQPLGGVVQISAFMIFLFKIAIFKCRCDKFSEI